MSTNFTVITSNSPLPSQVGKVQIIVESVKAAGMWLNSFIKGLGAIEINIRFDTAIATMNGGSTSNQTIGVANASNGKTYTLLQDSVPAEWQTGKDINGASPDAVISIGTTNLDRYYWFDPTLQSSSDIPKDKTDGFRVLLHELLHTLGFNGWVSTAVPGASVSIASQYDLFYITQGGRSYFVGPNAKSAFGGPVPVTGPHLGDATSFSQGVLTGSTTLMSYDFVPNGVRISLDPVVIGVLRDLGFTVRDSQAVFTGTGRPGEIGVARIDSTSAGYTLTSTLDLNWLSFKDKSDYSYLLQDIQRLQFTDKKIALDLKPTDRGGQALQLIGALAPDLVNNPAAVGAVLDVLDQGKNLHDVFQMALDSGLVESLAGSGTNTALVALIHRNVLGAEANSATIDTLVAYLDGRSASYSKADFLTIVAGLEVNQSHIGLVGLQQTGVEYL
jgi:hypothetical protein